MAAKDLVVIDDLTSVPPPPAGAGMGLKLPRGLQSSMYQGVAAPFPDELLIDRAEWKDRINERQKTARMLKDRLIKAGMKVKWQDIGYCWVFAPTNCVQIMRFLQNERMVDLSPASVGALIKKFRDVGGWGKEVLDFLQANPDSGFVPSELWPDSSLDRKLKNPTTDAERPKYQVVEWWYLEARNEEQRMSALLRGFPVAVGHNWWGHEVTHVDPVLVGSEIGTTILNTWGKDWSDRGFGVLKGNRQVADDAIVARAVVPS